MFAVAVPDLNSKPFDFARPIEVILAPESVLPVPRELVAALNKSTFLNASVSPETKPTSGAPNTFVTFTKLPTLNLVAKAFCVSKSLAFSTSTKVVPIVSISYPLTYALPGDNPAAILVSKPPLADV